MEIMNIKSIKLVETNVNKKRLTAAITLSFALTPIFLLIFLLCDTNHGLSYNVLVTYDNGETKQETLGYQEYFALTAKKSEWID